MENYSDDAIDKLFDKYVNGGRNLPLKSSWRRKTQFNEKVEIIEFEENFLSEENVINESQKDSGNSVGTEDGK